MIHTIRTPSLWPASAMLVREGLLSSSTAAAAADAVTSGRAVFIVVSGRMCSGKDSIAPDLAPGMGLPNCLRIGYSIPMREELDQAFQLAYAVAGPEHVLAAGAQRDIAEALVDVLRLAPEHGVAMAAKVGAEIVSAAGRGEVALASARTEGTRDLLQLLGSDWRQDQDVEYWPKRVVVPALRALAEGTSVYLTGGRYEPDVEVPRGLQALTVRLDVTRETQLRRLRERDGLVPTAATLAALDHPGETALDDWPHFDVRVDNNEDGPAAQAAVTDEITSALREIVDGRAAA